MIFVDLFEEWNDNLRQLVHFNLPLALKHFNPPFGSRIADMQKYPTSIERLVDQL